VLLLLSIVNPLPLEDEIESKAQRGEQNIISYRGAIASPRHPSAILRSSAHLKVETEDFPEVFLRFLRLWIGPISTFSAVEV